MNVRLISTCKLQSYLIIKEDANTVKPCAHPRLPKSLLEILPIYGNFCREKLDTSKSDTSKILLEIRSSCPALSSVLYNFSNFTRKYQ